ncbi:pilus assembly protein N-terminal domain-containing protein [Flexibacterium corallicola]|uniref:pilus assembly protein N-terminal domain-containing protein n=1 Tax=Flexibacterium corallicola TaxID=3037259 RepID=UPI00286F62EC|nr:pilus assembly protein N-terminal domain-containing protein [Pseudovibrio sp. M1P-2-3]
MGGDWNQLKNWGVLFSAFWAAILVVEAHAASGIDVITDQAKVFRIEEPASTVIVGNPSIADVVMHDRTTVIITGKSFGKTNLIILNDDSEPIVEDMLVVKADTDTFVSVHRSSGRFSYSCTPECEPVVRIGDEPSYFEAVAGQVDQHNTLGEGGQLASETPAE